jgi:hypothetical protein
MLFKSKNVVSYAQTALARFGFVAKGALPGHIGVNP